MGRSLSRLPRVWGLRGGALGSPMQALVPLEDPRAEAEGPCVCVGGGWKGCQAASPRSVQVPPGCPSRLACLNLGPGELVFPPRVAKGSKKRQINGHCLVPYPEGSGAPGEAKRSFICLLSLFYHFFPCCCHPAWPPQGGTTGPAVSQDPGKKRQGTGTKKTEP